MSIFSQFTQGDSGSKTALRKRQIARLLDQLIENEEEDRALFPQDAARWQPLLSLARQNLERYESMDPDKAVDAAILFYITPDGMHAYACMLPPLDGGAALRLDGFGQALQRSGITAGIDQELSLTFLLKQNSLHLVPIARGVPPQDGTDGSREYLFEPRPVFMLDGKEGESVDFSEVRPAQLLRRGDTVCNIIPPTPGKDGVDVTGRVLPCRHGVPAEVPIAHNLELSEDGLRLIAQENGAVFEKDGLIYVQTAIVRMCTLTKDDDFVWLAYVDGDIPEGIHVESTSGILVMGEIRGAEIHSKGSVRAQKGIRKGSKIDCRGQVLAPVIEDSEIKARRDVFAGKIVNSDVFSGGSVYVTQGEGLIQGGCIQALSKIKCTQIGSPEGGQNRLALGYSPALKEEIGLLTDELNETHATLELLRKNIQNLRMAGDLLSPEKRELLHQLIEQRDLYEERAAEQGSLLREAKDKLRSNHDSQALCQRLYPVTKVTISGKTTVFSLPETHCRIRLYSGQIVSK